ncbi:MAG: sugar transferase [Rhizobium sp.]|nr:sugar transferase [Rhizobium sp.]
MASPAASPLLKRLFDIAAAGALLLVLSPVLALTALAVGVALGRPLLFRQERCGRFRRSFTVSKFRTMSDARGADGTLLEDGQRQTPVTALLRRLRVDELPQLLAVLRGDMSFVGPRPLPAETVAAFGSAGMIRSSIAPGMTGWAQVNGNTLLTNDQKIALDQWYVERRTIWLDLWIVFLTLRTILLGETVNEGNVEAAVARFGRRPTPPIEGGDAV